MSRLTLRQKLWLPLVLSWLCLLLITLWNTREAHTLRLEERQRDLQNISGLVFSIIKDYERVAQGGKLTADEARAQTLTRIKMIRYGKDGHFSINQTSSVMVMHPIKAEMNGKDMSGFTDPAGNHLLEEISHMGKSGGGFVDYLWPKPSAGAPQPKKSCVLYYQPWDWYLVTGTYMDDIETALHASLVKALGLLFDVGSLMTMVVATVTRGLQRQLGGEPAYAARIAGRVAMGDLAAPVETRSGDRDNMLYAMAQMQRELTGTTGNIEGSTDFIASTTKQIAADNADLSQRTGQQTSSLEETASGMEEPTSTVKQNVDSVRQADTLAVNVSDITVKGGEAVGRAVETISGVNEDSRKIVDIIGVIEGITFQTSILTLNTAVEVARTGEQGRGSAVVADEVRSLAQRSTSAAREIEDLVGDSVGRVRNGPALVEEAGAVIQDVVTTVKHVTNVMGEISAASDERNSGVEQVSQAVSQIDEITQQNVALVEQAAAAAPSLERQAQLLRTVVGRFQV